MKPEDQVVSLELAKKLKELGFEQDSAFYYVFEQIYFRTRMGLYRNDGVCMTNTMFYSLIDGVKCSAYTVAELGEMMKCTIINFMKAYLEVMDLESVEYIPIMCMNLITDPNILAQMLIYLKENKLI